MGVSWKQRFFPQPFQILARALPQALGSRSELPAWCCQDCQGCGALLDPLCSLGRLILAVQDLVLASHTGWEWESPSGRCAAGASPGELCLHHLETLTQDLRLSPFMWCKPRAPGTCTPDRPKGARCGHSGVVAHELQRYPVPHSLVGTMLSQSRMPTCDQCVVAHRLSLLRLDTEGGRDLPGREGLGAVHAVPMPSSCPLSR